mgnify:CR=1 FL=1
MHALPKRNYPYFKVVQSAMPSYVNKAYIGTILQKIANNIGALSKAQKELCPLAWVAYNAKEDAMQVGIVKLTDAKLALFKQWISDWPYIEFVSESGYDMPAM